MRFTHLTLIVLLAIISYPQQASSADYRQLFREADPAVVVLYTTERQVNRRGEFGPSQRSGLGSGVVVDDQGHIITAAHVIQTAETVTAEFADGTQIQAAILASNPVKDVALLKLQQVPDNLKPARLGDSDAVEVGEEVFVIGAPYGIGHTLTIGHISGRHGSDEEFMGQIRAETFQTDAAINQGNSGGPMFNSKGEVIGIVSYILSKSGGFEGLGFAVTSNTVNESLFQSPMAWSGMTGITLQGAIARAFNLPQQSGYLIQKIAAGSPAAAIGLRPGYIPASIGGQELLIGGDIILNVEGVDIEPHAMSEVATMVDSKRAGDVVRLRVLRDGAVILISSRIQP